MARFQSRFWDLGRLAYQKVAKLFAVHQQVAAPAFSALIAV